ncbi:RsmB/NOP family class I SAM-dependent RNA methyltransferase [Candidatus Woesearchaeota archaeon]|nr:MAG: RsmB/NOP family class I SAM-dependent RNA methyltransferase [Candidatus Woesearchaeota archaeon]
MLEKIPQKIDIKEKFEKHYKNMLGNDYDEFMEYSLSYIRKAIRVNTLKVSVEELKKRLEKNWKLTPIPWCKEGFWIEYRNEKRFDIGNLLEHHLGYIYIQEAASMIPPVVLQPEKNETILDMCSAPGSKATQISALMENTGLLVCNDVKGDRLKALGINLQKAGCTNTVITLMPGERINMEFDRILVDAPCSGMGTIRKSLKTLKMWNMNLVERLTRTQKYLIDSAFRNLKKDGVLVYSTCTLEPLENEGIVSFLLEKYDNAKLEEIKLPIKRQIPISSFKEKQFHPDVKKCLRIHPNDNDTEGFFVARIRKD